MRFASALSLPAFQTLQKQTMHVKQYLCSQNENTTYVCKGERESYVLCVSTQLDFRLLYNSAVGAPSLCSSGRPWSSPSFPVHLLQNTQMSQGGAPDEGGEGLTGPGPWGSGCLSQVNKCVWSEIREGRTQTKIPAEELLWQLWLSECEGCWTIGATRLADKDKWVYSGSGELPLCDPKWEEWHQWHQGKDIQ